MGSLFSKIFGKLFNKEVKIIMVGLDDAGKTTILYKLKAGVPVPIIPTIGFNVETIRHKKFRLSVWDISGINGLRKLWYHYMAGSVGMIYVIDSANEGRLPDNRECIKQLLASELLQNIPILFFANKMDKAELSGSEIADELGLGKITSHKWKIQESYALTGFGLFEGLDWLVKQISGK